MTWKPFLALPNYLGGKRAICPIIFREIGKVYPPRTWPSLTLLDPFMGAGSVSLYAKAQGLQVLANDLALRSWVIGKAVIENNDQRLTDEDIAGIAGDGASPIRGFVGSNYVPHYFNPGQAEILDCTWAYAQTITDEVHQTLVYALLIGFAHKCRLAGQISNRVFATMMGAGWFDRVNNAMLASSSSDRFFTPPLKLLDLVRHQVNSGVFIGRAAIFQEDAMAFMRNHPADIVYLDPPYFGSTPYETNYYQLDCILAGRHLPKPRRNPFNQQRQAAWHSLCQMFEAAMHVPTWVFSFSDTSDGFSARQLCDLIADFGREPRVVPLQHRWSIATTDDHYNQGAQELLILAT